MAGWRARNLKYEASLHMPALPAYFLGVVPCLTEQASGVDLQAAC